MATETQTRTKQIYHFISDPNDVIHEALIGLTLHHPELSYEPKHKIVYRSDLQNYIEEGKVPIISFAGGGREPMFSRFIGPSFLSASVTGNIFASLTAAQILHAISLCQPDPTCPQNAGTLIVCGNYTSDILNAGLAITRARARGNKARFIAVGDDVAVGREKGGKVGRRGLAGHLVGLKVVCGMAEEGDSLDRCTTVMEEISRNVGTIGVDFDRVSLPTSSLTPLAGLPPDTIELGMGAHGEPGLQQISPPPSPEGLVKRIISLLTNTSDPDRSFIPFKTPLPIRKSAVLLLNSLGRTSNAVLLNFAELAVAELDRKGLKVERFVIGKMVTSLKMSGFGITVWRLPEIGEDLGWERKLALRLWDKRVGECCVGWAQ